MEYACNIVVTRQLRAATPNHAHNCRELRAGWPSFEKLRTYDVCVCVCEGTYTHTRMVFFYDTVGFGRHVLCKNTFEPSTSELCFPFSAKGTLSEDTIRLFLRQLGK